MSNDVDFIFTLKNTKFNVFFESDLVSSQKQIEIKNAIDFLAKEIYVDKTYVEYEGNKYDDVYLSLAGWNGLKTLLIEYDYGYSAPEDIQEVLADSYEMMALGYMYMLILKLYPEYINVMRIEVSRKSRIKVEIAIDTYTRYDNYPGKWQFWDRYN